MVRRGVSDTCDNDVEYGEGFQVQSHLSCSFECKIKQLCTVCTI